MCRSRFWRISNPTPPLKNCTLPGLWMSYTNYLFPSSRSGKVWNTTTGDELLTLDGHRNVVYAIAFNNPWGNKIITGSFDKTCKLWNAEVRVALTMTNVCWLELSVEWCWCRCRVL